MNKVKSSAITYTGYEYQTLHGVKILAEWLESPTTYKRICFEADDGEIPKGIDDIVCERSDSKIDYWQVKFTPSPDKPENRFTWEWLLKRTGKTSRSKSILQKLSSAIERINDELVGQVYLLTNKLPDRSIESCLNENKITYDSIDSEVRELITAQLGSADAAKRLFENLEIKHSDSSYHVLQREVSGLLEKATDEPGIQRLLNKARDWAKFQNQPSDGGWIYLHDIRAVISTKRPEPIPQSFLVPEHYSLPDDDFHDQLYTKITTSPGSVITVTGSPGRGKSTYLSYLCERLESNGTPVIRHHYFLSLDDRSLDRISPRSVAESLIGQINSLSGQFKSSIEKPEELHSLLSECASYYESKGIPFIVVIDGLDHVWRDNEENKSPLDELFKQLIPFHKNMTLIVGTQPIGNHMLPDALIRSCPKKDWYWLPVMSSNSILKYIKSQVASERLKLNCHPEQNEHEISEAADALKAISLGYPLHVIYTCEYLVANSKNLSAWEINKLPPCTDDNIHNYYNDLWKRLNGSQKDVLHLCCAFPFFWPTSSFSTVLDDTLQHPPSLLAVSHMLHESIAGVRPFHESLIVFIKSSEEHKDRVSQLLPKVCDWLKDDAPESIKNSWLWTCLAEAGDDSHLRQGVSRGWIKNRLAEGYPPETFIRLLEQAERNAFEELSTPEAYEHRAIKTRLINGPEFQIWDDAFLNIVSLVQAPESVITERFASCNDLSAKGLATLAIALWHRGESKKSYKCAHLALEKHRGESKLISRKHHNDEISTITLIIKAAYFSGIFDSDWIKKNNQIKKWPDEYIKGLIESSRLTNDVSFLIDIRKKTKSDEIKRLIENSVIRSSVLEDIDLTAWSEFAEFKNSKLSDLVRAYAQTKAKSINSILAVPEIQAKTKQITKETYHNWFFDSLLTRWGASGDYCWVPYSQKRSHTDVSIYFNHLCELADKTFSAIEHGGYITFDKALQLIDNFQPPTNNNYQDQREFISFSKEWTTISADCHLLTSKTEITEQNIDFALLAEHINIVRLRDWYLSTGQKVLTDTAAKKIIQLDFIRQKETLEETIDRSNGNLELARIALLHESKFHLIKATRACWSYVLGYGHHKDTTLLNVVTAIEYLSEKRPDEALGFLKEIAPIVSNICEITDGDETRHSLSWVSNLLSRIDIGCLVSKCSQEISDGEWYDAEISLGYILEKTDLSSDILKAFARTNLSMDNLKSINNQCSKGNIHASKLVEIALEDLGYDSIPKERKRNHDTTNNQQHKKLDYDIFPPSKFNNFLEELGNNLGTKEILISWYNHWAKKGKESDLVSELLSDLLKADLAFRDTRYLLDLLFISCKKIRGKKRAFDVIVKAQVEMNGWSDWYESTTKSLERLKTVASIYPDRADEFILKSTLNHELWRPKSTGLVIPNDKLVYLFTQLGRYDEAEALTSSMVDSIKDDTKNFKLTSPSWNWRSNQTSDSVSASLIVNRTKWPIPSTKWKATEEIADLLTKEASRDIIEETLLKELKKCKLESECAGLLTIFWIAKSKGYEPSPDIAKNIKARSILSDMLIEDISPGITDRGAYSLECDFRVLLSGDNNGFDRSQGSHVPRVYFSNLRMVEKQAGVPLTSVYISEWNKTFEYAPYKDQSIDYFFGPERGRSTGQFYTTSSHRGRSAYLRAIMYAHKHFGMPIDYAKDLAISALPIEPSYVGLIGEKPDWIAPWTADNDITKNTLKSYVQRCVDGLSKNDDTNTIGSVSLPIYLSENCWIDLTFTLCCQTEQKDIQFDLDCRSSGFSVGNKLCKDLKYEFRKSELEGWNGASPLLSQTYPVSRYGHWHSDIESRGIRIPTAIDSEIYLTGGASSTTKTFMVGKENVGQFGYWNVRWNAVHPKHIGPLCGTYTIVDRSKIEAWQPNKEIRYPEIMVCSAKVISREESYQDFSIKVINFHLPIKPNDEKWSYLSKPITNGHQGLAIKHLNNGTSTTLYGAISKDKNRSIHNTKLLIKRSGKEGN